MNSVNMRYMVYLIIDFLSSALSLEGVKACLADQRGGLILPIEGIPIEDKDWIKYKSLKKDVVTKHLFILMQWYCLLCLFLNVCFVDTNNISLLLNLI